MIHRFSLLHSVGTHERYVESPRGENGKLEPVSSEITGEEAGRILDTLRLN
jgi:hypothetical protein